MPSGAKKRKAAKKKMGNQTNNHSKPSTDSTLTHGDEDVKHHEEIDSDVVGEVSSPGSQDHHLPSTDGSRNNKSDVKVDRDFKIEGKSDGKDRSSSSSNSSDDEGHRAKNGAAIHNVPIESEQVKVEYLVEENEKKLNSVEYKVGTSLEKAIVQSPYNEPRASADNGVEHEKDSAVTEPLLVPTPCPVEKTSWKGCCGLFEVFSGSG